MQTFTTKKNIDILSQKYVQTNNKKKKKQNYQS